MKTPRLEGEQGFTRTELCVVLAVTGVLGCLVLPTLAREQTRDWRAHCLHRLSQLAQGLAMYAADNQDYLPPNPDDGNTTPGHNWCPGQAGVGGAQEFDGDILKDPKRSLLAPCLSNPTLTFKCPLDLRHGKYPPTGSDKAMVGRDVPAARTVSLNLAVGTNPNGSGAKKPVDGSWLDGVHGHSANKTFYCYGKTSDFVRPGPASTFTFIEEDPYSLNDGGLGCMGPEPQGQYRMIDWPSTLHGMAGAVAFADGHAELHRWVDNRTKVYKYNVSVALQSGNPDLAWLAWHATARIVP
jgi:hypothetical protein